MGSPTHPPNHSFNIFNSLFFQYSGKRGRIMPCKVGCSTNLINHQDKDVNEKDKNDYFNNLIKLQIIVTLNVMLQLLHYFGRAYLNNVALSSNVCVDVYILIQLFASIFSFGTSFSFFFDIDFKSIASFYRFSIFTHFTCLALVNFLSLKTADI